MKQTIRPRWESGGCLPIPLASIWITGRCNLTCKHCYEHGSRKQRFDLPKESVMLIMDRLAPFVASFSFMGGEPLLHPDLPELCAHAQRLGKYTLLVSNGTTVTRELVTALEGKVDCVKLGMDGVTAARHDAVRGQGSFAKTLAAWDILAPRIPTMCKFTLNAENISELPHIAPFYQNLGARRLILNGWLEVGAGASLWHRRFALSSGQREQINRYVAEVLKPDYHRFPVSRSCSLDHGCKDVPGRTFYVTSTAALAPCIFSGQLAIGNILDPACDVGSVIKRLETIRTDHRNLHQPTILDSLPELLPPASLPLAACRH